MMLKKRAPGISSSLRMEKRQKILEKPCFPGMKGNGVKKSTLTLPLPGAKKKKGMMMVVSYKIVSLQS